MRYGDQISYPYRVHKYCIVMAVGEKGASDTNFMTGQIYHLDVEFWSSSSTEATEALIRIGLVGN